jgi:hypothetical protein
MLWGVEYIILQSLWIYSLLCCALPLLVFSYHLQAKIFMLSGNRRWTKWIHTASSVVADKGWHSYFQWVRLYGMYVIINTTVIGSFLYGILYEICWFGLNVTVYVPTQNNGTNTFDCIPSVKVVYSCFSIGQERIIASQCTKRFPTHKILNSQNLRFVWALYMW